MGQRFSLDADEVLIGRGEPRPGQPGDVLLSDRHISRTHAMLRRVGDGWHLEHLAGTKSPTLVNGKPIESCSLQVEDQIEIGTDVLVLKATHRGGLSTLSLQALEADEALNTLVASQELGTLVSPTRVPKPAMQLVALKGQAFCGDAPFQLREGRLTLGRSRTSNFCVREPSISRTHLELNLEGDRVTLVHLSKTNPTFINGELQTGDSAARILQDGDEICICEAVVLKLDMQGRGASPTRPATPPQDEHPSSLTNNMRRLVSEEERIEKLRLELEARFRHTGSFLDIDVVDSTGLKGGESKTAYIIVSFDAFRAFVSALIEEFSGQVLNSNGDELMCFFAQPLDAVYCAEAIQARLPDFNATENKLSGEFKTRIGVHSGTSLVDLRRGKAYSNILDIAGHLQKASEVGGFLISAETLEQLPPALPFEEGPGLTKGGQKTYRPRGPLPRRDSLTV